MTGRGQRYEGAHEQLTERLNETVRIFAQEHGHRVPTPWDLRQMDRSLDHVAKQVVSFGYDVWPDDLDLDDEDGGGNPTPDIDPSFNFDHMIEPGAGSAFMTAYRRMFTPVSAVCALALALVLAPIEMSSSSPSVNALNAHILSSVNPLTVSPSEAIDGFSIQQGA